jgi:threonylcarbamoyladenosine tRNA methylthiotransferase MtaB
MNVSFITLGCKVNQIETEGIREMLLQNGFTADDKKAADIVLINSCTVTGESDKKVRRILSSARNKNPEAIIVLTGCLPQAFPEKAKELPADIITGTKNRKVILELIKKAVSKKEKLINIEKHKPMENFENISVSSFEGHTRAFMKIQDGCDRFCSYCIIPYARGHLRSKSLSDISAEAKTLSENGYKEITLTGINLSYYGIHENIKLSDAVLAVSEIEGIERIRLGSLQPDLIDEKMAKEFKKSEKFCPQFHLSLQSGSSSVLKRMNRPYSAEDFEKTVSLLRETFPDALFTTDIIVGFPGETEEEFRETLEFTRKIGFLKVHVFPYSRREGTPAADMEEQIFPEIKNKRKKRLISVCEERREKIIKSFIGKEIEVLVETKTKNGFCSGYTKNYVPILLKGNYPAGEIVKAKGLEYSDGALISERL